MTTKVPSNASNPPQTVPEDVHEATVAAGGRTWVSAALQRWPALLGVASAVVFFGDGDVDSLSGFAVVLIAMPIAYLVFGWAQGEFADGRVLAVQLAGLVAFTATAGTVLLVGGDLGRYVLAGGWFGHAVWDVVHHRSGRVVPRPWAEWCAVVDVAGAVALVAFG